MFATVLIILMTWSVMGDSEEINVQPPTDLKITVPSPGKVRATWKCNITEAMTNYTILYEVNSEDCEDDNTQIYVSADLSSFECKMRIHKGVSFKVCTVLFQSDHTEVARSNCAEEHLQAEGLPGSSVENVSCILYISSLNCTWNVGKEAPNDTQYFLYYGKDNVTECGHYAQDSEQRNIGCHISVLNIEAISYIAVNGSSKYANIQLYDTLIELRKIEKLSPPVNITTTIVSESLFVTWEPPPRIENGKLHCFFYEIVLQSKTRPEDKKIRTVPEELSVTFNFDASKSYYLTMRAKFSRCAGADSWSEWCDPITIGTDHKDDSFILVLAVLVVISLLSTLLILALCKRYTVVERMCPQVPDPKNKFKDLFVHHNQDVQKWLGSQTYTFKDVEKEEVTVYVEEMA